MLSTRKVKKKKRRRRERVSRRRGRGEEGDGRVVRDELLDPGVVVAHDRVVLRVDLKTRTSKRKVSPAIPF